MKDVKRRRRVVLRTALDLNPLRCALGGSSGVSLSARPPSLPQKKPSTSTLAARLRSAYG